MRIFIFIIQKFDEMYRDLLNTYFSGKDFTDEKEIKEIRETYEYIIRQIDTETNMNKIEELKKLKISLESNYKNIL